ncbi:condensation domain-containing protein [Amycolatopsis mediterranei]|uniref:condensation domain-containing protein n=1 Tax=Amycolatopsis mediterranei TaxID=33910 RepID=UPI003440968F
MTSGSLSSRYREAFTGAFGGPGTSGDVLPAGSSQRRFAIAAESSGRRMLVPYAFSLRAGVLAPDELRARLAALVLRHPALRCAVEFEDDGLVAQRAVPGFAPPCEVLETATPQDEIAAVRGALTEAALDGERCPLRAALLRGPEADRLLLVFDHAVIDETSLRVVSRDLFTAGPATPGTSWVDYASSAWRWLEWEVAAATEEAVAYWTRRLVPVVTSTVDEPAPVTTAGTVVDAEPVPVASPRVRATVFPRLLAATHRALRATGPSTVIFPWGARPAGLADVAGCFMNTVYSGVRCPAESAVAGWRSFAAGVWEDLEHAHVPFDDVVVAVNRDTRTGWTGTARCLLGFEDLTTVERLGPPGWDVREWLPPWLAPKCQVNTTVRFDGRRLGLRVVADPAHLPPDAIAAFASEWREQVAAHLSF